MHPNLTSKERCGKSTLKSRNSPRARKSPKIRCLTAAISLIDIQQRLGRFTQVLKALSVVFTFRLPFPAKICRFHERLKCHDLALSLRRCANESRIRWKNLNLRWVSFAPTFSDRLRRIEFALPAIHLSNGRFL